MARPRQRTIEWGDGYVTQRVLKSGAVRHQARWKEPHPLRGFIWRSRDFPADQEQQAYDHLRAIGRLKRSGDYEPESTLTLTQAVSEFAEVRLQHGKWTANTYTTNKILQTRLIDPQIGTVRITRLKARELQAWADRLSQIKSVSVVRSSLSIIRGALRRQIQHGVITHNPADAVDVRARTQGNVDTWQIEEVRAMLQASRDDAMMYALYLLGFDTGMRPGELRGLRWSDIDWATNVVTVARTITKGTDGREIVGTTTKNGKARVIVIGQAIADALARWKAIQNERRLMHGNWLDTMVFDRGDGHFIAGSSLLRKHDLVIEAAGVPRYPLHTMRHTYATLEDAAGTSPGVTKARLGHASESFTIQRYTHAQIGTQTAAAEHVAQLLLGENEDTTTESDSG